MSSKIRVDPRTFKIINQAQSQSQSQSQTTTESFTALYMYYKSKCDGLLTNSANASDVDTHSEVDGKSPTLVTRGNACLQ